jgi:hypothetical protein
MRAGNRTERGAENHAFNTHIEHAGVSRHKSRQGRKHKRCCHFDGIGYKRNNIN